MSAKPQLRVFRFRIVRRSTGLPSAGLTALILNIQLTEGVAGDVFRRVGQRSLVSTISPEIGA